MLASAAASGVDKVNIIIVDRCIIRIEFQYYSGVVYN
jgi:hypothetical protein